MDLWLPENANEKIPLLIFLNDGLNSSSDKKDIEKKSYLKPVLDQALSNGIAVVSPDYRKPDQSNHLDTLLNDMDGFTEWMVNHSSDYSINIQQLGIVGEGIGGLVSLLLAYQRKNRQSVFPQSRLGIEPKLRFVINILGPTSLDRGYQDLSYEILKPDQLKLEELEVRYLYGLDLISEEKKVIVYDSIFSPVNYVKQDNPPTMLVYDVIDTHNSFHHAQLLSKEILWRKGSVELVELSDISTIKQHELDLFREKLNGFFARCFFIRKTSGEGH